MVYERVKGALTRISDSAAVVETGFEGCRDVLAAGFDCLDSSVVHRQPNDRRAARGWAHATAARRAPGT